MESQQIVGPFPLITWWRECACVSAGSGPRWIPGENIKPYIVPLDTVPRESSEQEKDTQKDEKRAAEGGEGENLHATKQTHST